MTGRSDNLLCEWLLGEEAGRLLVELAAKAEPLHTMASWLRKQVTAEQSHALLELAELRVRGQRKFLAAERMFFTRLGLEQATDQWVAEYKAKRFAKLLRVADLCTGIGGDAIALAAAGFQVTAVDLDAGLLRFASANLAVHGQSFAGEKVQDAGTFAVKEFDAWHIDPDRRAADRRSTQLAVHSPNGQTIEQMLHQNPNAAIKLAPATDIPETWQRNMELEWISRGGECKQQVAWSGCLARAPGVRRATALSRHGTLPATFISTPDIDCEMTSEAGESLYDADAALLAAGIANAAALGSGLRRLGSGATYYTGPSGVQAPLMKEFVIDAELPLRTKPLAAYCREHNLGRLEMKQRGTQHDLPKLRKALKLQGEREASLLLTRVGSSEVAFFAHRAEP